MPKPRLEYDPSYCHHAPVARTVEENLWRIDWRKNRYPYCGVYVISADSLTPCKIGISTNPLQRLMELQTAHWRYLQVSGYRWCLNSSDARKIEQKAHAMFRSDKKELLGEWFDIRPKHALEAIDFAGDILGIEVRRDCPDETVRGAIQYILKTQKSDEMTKAHEDIDAEFARDGIYGCIGKNSVYGKELDRKR